MTPLHASPPWVYRKGSLTMMMMLRRSSTRPFGNRSVSKPKRKVMVAGVLVTPIHVMICFHQVVDSDGVSQLLAVRSCFSTITKSMFWSNVCHSASCFFWLKHRSIVRATSSTDYVSVVVVVGLKKETLCLLTGRWVHSVGLPIFVP
jgi:hypothetical protein